MNKKEKEVLKHNHDMLVENLEPKDILSFLLQNDVIENINFLDDEPIREHRVEKLLKYLKDNCTFVCFVQALSYADNYSYIADKLQRDKGDPPPPPNLNLYCARRVRSIKFRQELTQCIFQADEELFNRLCTTAVEKWENIPRYRMHTFEASKRQEMADMYFMAVDAKIEKLQIYVDDQLSKSELFKKLAKIAHQTTNPSLPNIVHLARYGEALALHGVDLQDAMSYVNQAKDVIKECRIPNCRETGIVLCAQFHIQVRINEQNATKFDRNILISLAEEAIKHFQEESETISDQLERTMLLEIALVYLGMGLYLNFVEEKDAVRENDIRNAETIIKDIIKEDIWCHLGLRTQMICYSIKSRVSQLHNKKEEALRYAKKSLAMAEQAHYKMEIKSIENNIHVLKELTTVNSGND